MKFPAGLARLNHFLSVVSGGLLMLIGCLSVLEVFMRSVLNRPTVWTMDISQFSLIWAIFIGAGYAFQEKAHVRVDLFTEVLPPKAKKAAAIFGYAVVLGFVAVLTQSAVTLMRGALRLNRYTISMVQIPQWILITAILLGCGLMMLTLIGILLDLIGNGKKYL